MSGVKQCYMCDAPATSREHVPPKCIFPERKDLKGQYLREGLITVPSCEIHNSKKSADDEFLMVSIAGIFGNNSIGYLHKMTKVSRAIRKASYRLLDQAFLERKHFAVEVENNKFVGVIYGTPDIERLRTSFLRIAFGLYYHHFGEKFRGKTWVHLNFLDYKEKKAATFASFIKHRVELELKEKDRHGKNPTVFYYQFTDADEFGFFTARMRFYEGIEVLVAFLPEDKTVPFNLSWELIDRGIKSFIKLEGKIYEFN